MAQGSRAGASVELWENSFQTSLYSSFYHLVEHAVTAIHVLLQIQDPLQRSVDKDRSKEEKLTNDVKVAALTPPPPPDAASRRRRRFRRIGYRWKQQRGRRLPST